LFDLILSNFYWRNTKGSIPQEDYEIPPFKNQLVLLDFQPIEKALYDDCLEDEAVCTPFDVLPFSSLSG
jgi:hypothetical protein